MRTVVLNEAGVVVLEHKVATTPEAINQVFGSMPRCRMAMETGTHSPLLMEGVDVTALPEYRRKYLLGNAP